MADKKSADKRVRYTKLFLREALLDLMKEKPVGKITPTELCRRAEINRNTFYAHYNSPEELLSSIEEEFFTKVKVFIDENRNPGHAGQIENICKVIYENADMCSVLLSGHGDIEFLYRIIATAHDQTISEWKSFGLALSDDDMEMIYTYNSHGCVAAVREWLDTGMKKSPAELAALLSRLISGGILSFMPRKLR